MNFLYSAFIALFDWLLPVIKLFIPRLQLFADGRQDIFKQLTENKLHDTPVLWFHCASLGEYEQGVPVMEALKKKHPDHKLLVTFFSPSGYEVKKNSKLADVIVYLPLDTKANARKFIKLVNPSLAIFVKYEFWPNYFAALKKNTIPTAVISASFRESQVFFKWYGGFMRNTLQAVDHFFVQNATSQELLNGIGLTNVTISGDTRFDRVSNQIEMDNRVDFIEEFIGERLCIVIGSSWPEDEAVFIDFVNQATKDVCFIIAPHEVKEPSINSLRKKLTATSISFSEKEGKNLNEYQVFVMNTIGYLSRVYSYAKIAYVGGGMGTVGLHNVLEPATFGIPIIIGKNFEKFGEAKELHKLTGLFSVSNANELSEIMNKLVTNEKFRKQTGIISGHYVSSNRGATAIIVEHLTQNISKPTLLNLSD